MREVIRAYQDAVAGEIARFEGHVAKFMGDGVLAYFGWPTAHEDDAERAVRAGLAVVEAVAGCTRRTAQPLAARVGIATGLVVVGDLVGEGAAQERGGGRRDPEPRRPPAGAGRARTAWSSPQSTRRLLGGLFESPTSGRSGSRASPSPCALGACSGQSAAEGRFEALHGDGPDAAGRARAGAGAAARPLGAGQDGEGQVVLLVGRARHRQVAPRPRAARAAGRRAAHAAAPLTARPTTRPAPLYPVIEQLERAAGFARDDAPAAKLDKLEALLAAATEDVGCGRAAARGAACRSRPATATRRSS